MISAVILTKNSADTIENTLLSLKALPEVIVVDNGSTDATMEIARQFPNCHIMQTPFTTFGKLRNLGAERATFDWILAIDSDEVLTDCLPDLKRGKVYSFPFHNFYNGKWIKWCGWYPDRHTRLYNRLDARFSEDAVHEKLQCNDCATVALSTPINHYSYRSLTDFSRKMELYSNLFAEQNAGKKRSSPFRAAVHGLWAFFKSYVIKRGVLGGAEGRLISLYNGKTAYHKYLKLWKVNRQC